MYNEDPYLYVQAWKRLWNSSFQRTPPLSATTWRGSRSIGTTPDHRVHRNQLDDNRDQLDDDRDQLDTVTAPDTFFVDHRVMLTKKRCGVLSLNSPPSPGTRYSN